MKRFTALIALSLLAGILTSPTDAAPHNDWTLEPVPSPAGWADAQTDQAEFGWYRAYVEVPKSWEGSRLLLIAGGISEVDEAYFNGERIGSNGSLPPLYNKPSSNIRRPFVIEPDQVDFGGPNLIAWRVYKKSGKGGIISGIVHLSRKNDAIDLSGNWLFRKGDNPAWSQWPTARNSAAAKAEFAAYQKFAGEKRAGHRGIVPADAEGRKAMLAAVEKKFENNKNPYARNDDKGKPSPPEAARKLLQPGAGLAVDTVLAEPVISQPLYVDFDERGRMWVSEYRQYPNPAGLEVLTWDNHLRKVFDVVPPPPPYKKPEHKKFIGADIISIHEDTDGDGSYDKSKVFVDGLNMVTSTTRGRGGVWVMHPPYLLFYPDTNNDDIPDSDPVVHLSGFGLEDTHSIANSLKFGPDGWLYGGTGSTVTARVRVHLGESQKRHAFLGQNIWRYHPEQHVFELFAEGGWNTFGVDFDDKGRVYSGTNGTQQAVHFVQGGYYQKGFGKHGPHTNPYAFGHLYGLPIKGEPIRLVHQWIYYDSGAIPSLEGKLVGGNSLANKLHTLRMETNSSTFRTIEEEKPLTSTDQWFRPVHCTAGPDGAIYISDFYDARITHVDPRDNWDRERGRVYRLRSADATYKLAPHLGARSGEELVKSLQSRNQWERRTAQRLLADRKEQSALPSLLNLLRNGTPQGSLEALWAIHGIGMFKPEIARIGLRHKDPHVRVWTVRLLGDPKQAIEDDLLTRLVQLAGRDAHPEVISQLAATTQRLPASQAILVMKALTGRDTFTSDPYIPYQLWWALESIITRDRDATLTLIESPETWKQAMFADHLIERIGRRFMAARSAADLKICARLLGQAPSREQANLLIRGMEKALEGSSLDSIPPELDQAIGDLWKKFKPGEDLIRFSLRLKSSRALDSAREMIGKASTPVEQRLSFIKTLAELGDAKAGEAFLQLIGNPSERRAIRLAALTALRRYSNPSIPGSLLKSHKTFSEDQRKTAHSLLAGRPDWAVQLLEAVEAGSIPRESIAFDSLLLIKSYKNEKADALIAKHWGALRQTSEKKNKMMDEIRKLLASRKNDGVPAEGKKIFSTTCAVCHQLDKLGRDIGPNLTGYEMGNTEFLLSSIVDPNLGVREEYELATITLRSDQENTTVISGFISDATDRSMTIKDLVGNKTVIVRTDIANEVRTAVSLMPEGLLDALSDQQTLDLFAFLQSQKPPKKK